MGKKLSYLMSFVLVFGFAAGVTTAAEVVYELTSDGDVITGTITLDLDGAVPDETDGTEDKYIWSTGDGPDNFNPAIVDFSIDVNGVPETFEPGIFKKVMELVLATSDNMPLTLFLDSDWGDGGTPPYLYTDQTIEFGTGEGHLDAPYQSDITGAALMPTPSVVSVFPMVATIEEFDDAQDLVADGVDGTFWDGLVVGEGADAVVDVNISRSGQLYLESTNGVWSGPWDPLGPYVYKVIKGDFVASVHVSDYPGIVDSNDAVFHNSANLMARNVNDEDAGDGEDWVSIDYFPIWGVGNIVRTADDGDRAESANQGTAWDGLPYLQLERQGNTFYTRISADGETWQDVGDPIVRDDFDGLPVQVGVAQATFSGDTGYAAFDNFSLISTMSDDFEVAHDYDANGVAGTSWDGLVMSDGSDAVIDANVTSAGQLHLESTNAVWSGPWEILGPYLYRVVQGNFIASVLVSDYPGVADPNEAVYHNSANLMARNVNDEDAGDGEDWVSIDYFPIWGVGNIVRTADDGDRAESANQGTAWDGLPYLQLERQGNTFYTRISADGETWQDVGDPIVRDDFDGLPVQVGVAQATFSGDTGYADFDTFLLETYLSVD